MVCCIPHYYFTKCSEKIQKKEGFKFNPYDPCVANKKIKGKQLTIVFHVDDVKVSSVRKTSVEDFIQWIDWRYGQKDKPITVSRGKKHDYLAMTLDYSEKGKVKVDMRNYIKSMIEYFPTKLNENDVVSTPANENLFKKDNSKQLDQKKAEIFHTVVAKGLFVSKRARPDIQPTIAVLCTRVKDSNEGDWKKLLRLIKYLNGTREMVLTLSADNASIIKWYVDVAFAVHPDFKSHTGIIMKMGKGAIQSVSRKQKMNTRSSTKAELLGANE